MQGMNAKTEGGERSHFRSLATDQKDETEDQQRIEQMEYQIRQVVAEWL